MKAGDAALETPSELRRGTAPVHLVRGLGSWGAALVTVGSIVGTGIFLTPGDVARAAPHAALVLFATAASGLLTVAGALTYAELGVLFPRAGGIYHFLKEAYGPRWGFLYGWASFFVIMSGGIAAIAMGAASFLGAFLPWASPDNLLVQGTIAGHAYGVSGAQITAVLAIFLFTAVNHVGLGPGARLQQTLVAATVVAIVGLIAVAFGTRPLGSGHAPVATSLDAAAPLPFTGLLGGFGVAMVAMLWTYDGWYGLTISAGELRDPKRDLPRGLIGGTLAVTILYVLLMAAYLRALPVESLAAAPRPAEAAAAALSGPVGARIVSIVALASALGCLASTILYSSRLYQPMARDGLFFAALGDIHPRWRTPVRSLWAQSGWAMLLALSGTYTRLYTFTTCAVVAFHVATAAAVFVLRRKRPDAPRPYRVPGYPIVPVLFALACLALLANALRETPLESGAALAVLALGLPISRWWQKRAALRSPER